MKFAFTFLFTCFSTILIAQTTTNSATIKKSLEKKSQMIQTSLVKNIAFTNIGPTVMSGRVADIAVNPEDPTEFYVVMHPEACGTRIITELLLGPF